MIVIFDNGREYSDHVYAIVKVPAGFDAEAFVRRARELFVQFNDYEPQEWWRPIFKATEATWFDGEDGPLPIEDFVKTVKERLGAYNKAAWEQEDRELAPENFVR
jgi:hypothetical protein